MNKPSIWYWVIGVLGLLWNFGGAYDYVMTRTANPAYMAQYPQELLDYWYDMPVLMDITWPLAVWGGVLGWILMLWRRKWAVPVFIVSLVAMIVNFGYTAIDGGLAMQAEFMGPFAYVFTGLIVLGALFAVWFSRREAAKGTLS
ncbi:MAG: hypothetical protein WBG08_01150 [Litorimonas sp.]